MLGSGLCMGNSWVVCSYHRDIPGNPWHITPYLCYETARSGVAKHLHGFYKVAMKDYTLMFYSAFHVHPRVFRYVLHVPYDTATKGISELYSGVLQQCCRNSSPGT